MPTSTERSVAPVAPSSPASQGPIPQLGLELPVAPGFVPVTSPVSAELCLEISTFYLPRLLARPEFWKERAEERCLVEFDLDHPERVPATYPAALLTELFWGA